MPMRLHPASVRRSKPRWPQYFAPEDMTHVCDRYRAIYAGLGPPGSSCLAGAAEAVDAVRHHGGTTLVITAKFEPNAHLCLNHVGIAVDHVIGWRHGPQKGETLREHGAHVYVGDTIPDIHAALTAGAHAIGVATGPVTASDLAAAGADIVFVVIGRVPRLARTFRRRVSRVGQGLVDSTASAAAYPVSVLLST